MNKLNRINITTNRWRQRLKECAILTGILLTGQTLTPELAIGNSGQTYQACLFGDSITSGLGNSLGEQRVNFAAGGLSTVSLITRLERLVTQNTQCQTAIVAIGTNDAWYDIDDAQFEQNMTEIIALVRSLSADRIYVLPAFYSSLAASQNPKVAGTVQRIDEINQLIKKVAIAQRVTFAAASIQPLFAEKTLKPSLTGDGVHLNPAGKAIYRESLLELLDG